MRRHVILLVAAAAFASLVGASSHVKGEYGEEYQDYRIRRQRLRTCDFPLQRPQILRYLRDVQNGVTFSHCLKDAAENRGQNRFGVYCHSRFSCGFLLYPSSGGTAGADGIFTKLDNCTVIYDERYETCDQILTQLYNGGFISRTNCGSPVCGAGVRCAEIAGGVLCGGGCNDGFFQAADGSCVNHNECLNQPCGANTVCQDNAGSFTCECWDGYSRVDWASCANIDECSVDPAVCGPHATCEDLDGSFACHNSTTPPP